MRALVCDVCPVLQLPELWRPVRGLLRPASLPYDVSTHGRVRRADTLQQMTVGVHATGYRVVTLGRANRTLFVHRLVAFTFLGDPPRTGWPMEVDHLDFDKGHNHVRNLRWLTKDSNQWRWKFWAELEPPDLYDDELPLTAAELREHERRWGTPPLRRPDELHRHPEPDREPERQPA